MQQKHLDQYHKMPMRALARQISSTEQMQSEDSRFATGFINEYIHQLRAVYAERIGRK